MGIMFKSMLAWLLPTTTTTATTTTPSQQPSQEDPRPTMVLEALARNESLYYFGLGSNMLRSKVEGRAVGNDSKIEILDMQPAIVHGHRLAFNLRGFPPLEPSMGSLEPVLGDSSGSCGDKNNGALYPYHKQECHGALICLTAENYIKVMKSEGVGNPNMKTPPSYEEVVVTAVPYDQKKRPVQAVALRARPHARLAQDPAPSLRYMNLLREGAAELGLRPCYQEYLANHPVQIVPKW
eukprot:CAMPEP_0118710510 /NCGR_PEP_ID=MMETSP0800-20121206/23430_1 /TAXON_ID=210618 ORGANISM="Striatella unipunctata, Strain CCMP2910" /NCGR_SAMPLE_ID=MMETSP0800 /ASSEMBLY_ACC=CAM_ASM_000638 /LENGTH=237 /DNA_ID=CAMNT_0006614717 /DNA_START=56 /DNA_END=766 /DNA_ORIENTATION=-